MENREWGTGNGEQGIGNGEWGTGNGERGRRVRGEGGDEDIWVNCSLLIVIIFLPAVSDES